MGRTNNVPRGKGTNREKATLTDLTLEALVNRTPAVWVGKQCLQCPPHQCVDDLGSHTCGWSAQGFLPYSQYDVNVLILYGRYQGPLATGHRLVGLCPAMLSEK